ncbi:MAG: hypothetical protein JKY22_09080, partial [Flavobacteriaceae bacterium]|nr:hypothetical protein [Flavobacteriaceae bacterium]
MFAQEDFICATEDDFDTDPPIVYSGSTDQAVLDAMDPVVLNIYYWRIDDQFGNVHPNAITEQRALEGIAFLNITYN